MKVKMMDYKYTRQGRNWYHVTKKVRIMYSPDNII